MLPEVVAVQALGGHRLRIRFDDGAEGDLDFTTVLTFAGVFEPLRDPVYFAKVYVDADGGTIAWPNHADVDPVVLYSWVTKQPLPDWASDAPRLHLP